FVALLGDDDELDEEGRAEQPLLQADAGFDTTDYVTLAQQVLAGNLALGPGLYYVSPLYIYFLAAALGVFQSLTAVRVVQALAGTMTVGLVFMTAREWYGSRAAWWAAGLAALTGLLTFHEVLVLQSALDAVLVALALFALTLGLTRGGWRWFLIAGVVFGLDVLNRPNVGLAAAVIVAGLLAIRRVRAGAAVVAGVALALSPVVVRNVAVSHQLALVSSHGGVNFYIGNSASANGYYWQIPGVRPSITGQAVDTRRVAEQSVGHALTDAEVSDYFFGLGWAWIRAHPRAALWLFVRKAGDVFNAHYIALPFSYAFFAYDLPTLLAACVIGPAVLIPLALVGFVAAAPRERLREYLVWLLFVPAYAVAVAVFFMAERYRVPLLVPLAVGAGGAIDRLVSVARARDWRSVATLAAAVAVLAAAVNWPLGTDDGRNEDRMRYAEVLATRGQLDAAERWVARVVEDTNNPAGAHARFGGRLLDLGQAPAALAHYRKAHELKPEDRVVELGLGQALLDAGRGAEAVPLLRDAIEHGAGAPLAGYDLARALAQSGNRAEAVRALALVVMDALPEIDGRVGLDIGRFGLDLDAPAAAERFLNRAVGLLPGDAMAQAQLALCDLKLSRPDSAREHARAALALDPNNAVAQQVMQAVGKK
ncbi:MAG: tetratricopeptide repeat protein, partial [Vicinamibacterales bacterium]